MHVKYEVWEPLLMFSTLWPSLLKSSDIFFLNQDKTVITFHLKGLHVKTGCCPNLNSTSFTYSFDILLVCFDHHCEAFYFV